MAFAAKIIKLLENGIWVGGEFADLFTAPPWIACVAGRISVGVLYRFGGRVARRVVIQVNLKSRLPQFLGILNSPQPGLREFLIG